MPKVAPAQTSFTGGEFSPLAQGRVDSDRYRTGLDLCENYIPTTQGPITRRGGTHFVGEVKYRTKKTRLVPFQFSTTQAYVIEFGDQYCRFYKDNAVITNSAKTITAATKANPVVVTSAAHGFSTGDRVIISGVSGMVELNNREFRVGTTAANTFELSDTDGLAGINGTAYTTYASGGSAAKPYEISTPYLEADLAKLKFVQSSDTLYIVHPSYAPRKLTRTAHTSWTLSTISFYDGPYLPPNTQATGITITPTVIGAGPSYTVTSSTALFASTDVGRHIRVLVLSTWGWGIITAYASSTSVTVRFYVAPDASGTATYLYRLGVFSDTTGYPSCVTFHEDRLCFAGVASYPQRVDMSASGDYETFSPSKTDATVISSNAVGVTLNSSQVNVIRWISSDEKGMQVGTNGGEWIIRPSSLGEALSPTNVSAKRTSSYGSADISPVQVGKATLFVQTAGRKMRELRYFYESDGFEAPDISKIAEHITNGGVTGIAFQQTPHAVIWGVRSDGVLLGCTYEREVDTLVAGWHRHIIGGSSDAAGSDSVVESIAVIPSADGTRDELWLVVKRYVSGAVKRYVEYMGKIFEDSEDQKDAFHVDAGLTYDAPVAISGATQANPAVITATAHGFSNGDKVLISDVLGMTELNGESFLVANKTANTFELHTLAGNAVDSSAYGYYVSGGYVRKYISTVTGLWHLNGETVDVFADGAEQTQATVVSGAVTLSSAATTVHIGYRMTSKAKLLRFDAGSANGTSMGKTRRVHRLGLFLYRCLGLEFGFDFDTMDEISFRSAGDALTRAVPLYSGIKSLEAGAPYDTENQICLRQDGPHPGTILAVFPQMETQDR